MIDNKNLSSLISPTNNDENNSPFQSFSEFTKNQPKLKMFETLQIQPPSISPSQILTQQPIIKSPINLQSNSFLSPKNLIPPNLYRLQVTQQSPISQNQNQLISNNSQTKSIAKYVILFFVLFIALLLMYKQIKFSQLLSQLPQYTQKYPQNMKSSLWLKQYQQMLYVQQTKIKQSIHQQIIVPRNMSYFVNQVFRKKKDSKLYLQIQTVQNIKKLPFCLFVNSDTIRGQKQIIKSIIQTKYQNYNLIIQKITAQQQNKYIDSPQIHEVKLTNFSHSTIMQTFFQKCTRNSLIMFIRSPVHKNIFTKLNTIHQNWNTYLAYTKKSDIIQIHTFYLRIFQLLELNDFLETNKQYLNKGNLQIWALGLLELTAFKNKQINGQQIYINQGARSTLLVNLNNQKLFVRHSYNSIKRLSEDLAKNLFKDNENFKKSLHKIQMLHENYLTIQKLSIDKLHKAQQYQDFLYLPQNHSLNLRQIKHYNKHYNIKSYQSKQKQLPLCICILSHNNIADNRYKKVLLSIVQQQYTNYHIVFFDDQSDDQTFQKTISYLKQLGFPQNKAAFVKNLQRKYATYNILNGAFNFCKQDDIQVLVDGDDQLIGWHVFNLINSAYQQNQQKWVIYTNFKSNLYQLGQSRPVTQKSQIISSDNKRVGGHYLGQLRTWKIKVIRAIPKIYHQARGGYWLDTVYDDALQHSLFQLSSVERVMYIPQICYQYNREHGDNDDSSQQKLNNRKATYEYLLSLPPLKQVYTLQEMEPNEEMVNLFKKELQSKTFQVVSVQRQQKDEEKQVISQHQNKIKNKKQDKQQNKQQKNKQKQKKQDSKKKQ